MLYLLKELEETGAETKRFRQRVDRAAANRCSMKKVNVFIAQNLYIKTCKDILVEKV